ncbi:TetR/AcrR family transcriptional regulator [Marispirochaeta sp.]|uniref:TetR/AcrR family transcriptional regulator n=1 Tax=Marispirochaeta sp. TaxID=2038653 RepID=UPI0029C7939E|nr:TetR/AcrR family transcriptional regulator [Marispirochaeta sp.]
MGIIERKLRDKKRRTEEIINAARRIFMRKGYTDATMLDIAEESELSRRTLYLYFKSKEEISFELMYEAFTALYQRLLDSYAGDGTALDKLNRFKHAYLAFYNEDFDNFYFTVYFNVKLNLKNMQEGDAEQCFEVIQQIITLLTRIIEEGIREGIFRFLPDARRSAFVLAEMIQASMQQIATRRDVFRLSSDYSEGDVLAELFDLAVHSIIAHTK